MLKLKNLYIICKSCYLLLLNLALVLMFHIADYQYLVMRLNIVNNSNSLTL